MQKWRLRGASLPRSEVLHYEIFRQSREKKNRDIPELGAYSCYRSLCGTILNIETDRGS